MTPSQQPHTPNGECPANVEICPEVDCDICRGSSTKQQPHPCRCETCRRTCGIRPSVIRFAMAKELVLRNNDHKSGWDAIGFYRIVERIEEEIGEVHEELDSIKSGSMRRASKEVVDVANFCMMFFDNLYNLGPNVEYIERKLVRVYLDKDCSCASHSSMAERDKRIEGAISILNDKKRRMWAMQNGTEYYPITPEEIDEIIALLKGVQRG